MSPSVNDHPHEGAGILFAGAAYTIWGFVPLYWRLLADVSPLEITVHRVLWCALFTVLVTLGRRRIRHIIAILRNSKLFALLAITSLLISANWTLFIWCVSTHRLVEASLGYYLTPLVSIALGIALLGERVSKVRLFAIGVFPWVAPALALSFGFYGYLRKLTPVDSIDGLTIETVLLFPITASIVAYFLATGTGALGTTSWTRDALLVLAGPVTAAPL